MDMAHGGILETTDVGNGGTAEVAKGKAYLLAIRLRALASNFEKKGFWSSKPAHDGTERWSRRRLDEGVGGRY